MAGNKEFGKWGEQYAKEELLKKGLKFIASNFTFKKTGICLFVFLLNCYTFFNAIPLLINRVNVRL